MCGTLRGGPCGRSFCPFVVGQRRGGERLCEIDARIQGSRCWQLSKLLDRLQRRLCLGSGRLGTGEPEAVLEVVGEELDEALENLDGPIPIAGDDAIAGFDDQLVLTREGARQVECDLRLLACRRIVAKARTTLR